MTRLLSSLEPSDHVHYGETTLVPRGLRDPKHLGLHVPAEVSHPPLVDAPCRGPDVADQVLGLLQNLKNTHRPKIMATKKSIKGERVRVSVLMFTSIFDTSSLSRSEDDNGDVTCLLGFFFPSFLVRIMEVEGCWLHSRVLSSTSASAAASPPGWTPGNCERSGKRLKTGHAV